MRLTHSKWLRPVRVLVMAFACLLMVFSYVSPAYAAFGNPLESSSSQPGKGEEPLNEIFDESENALRKGVLSGEDTRKRANEGLNEVQGAADVDRMYSPENSDADTVEGAVERGLKNLTGR